jgi:UDP-N-acetyl-D-glucosamine 4,6-dehydratase
MEAVFETLWARSITPNHVKRVFFFLFSDVLISLFSLYSAYLLRFNFSIPTPFLAHFPTAFITLLLIKLFFLYLLKNYSVIWRFYGLNDAKRLFIAHITTYTLFLIIFLLYPQPFLPFPRSVIIIDFFLSFTFLGALRFIKRLIIESSDSLNTPKSTLIFGISSNTDTLIKTLLRDGYYVHAILVVQEHNLNMVGSFIHNIKIFGLNDLPMLMSKYPIQSAIIEGSLQQDILREVYEKLKGSSVVEIKRSITLGGTTSAIESLCVEDLLARHPKDLDTATW